MIKDFNADDGIFYESLRSSSNRDDYLVTSFSNLLRDQASCYLAITTKYINIIDEKSQTVQFELAGILKIVKPADNHILLEYKHSNGSLRKEVLRVTEGRFTATEIVEEIHLQISYIVSKA